MRKSYPVWISILVVFAAVTASAQSFRVQCPTSTITHPDPTNAGVNNSEPTYNGPTQFNGLAPGVPVPYEWGLCHTDRWNRERRHQVPANLGR